MGQVKSIEPLKEKLWRACLNSGLNHDERVRALAGTLVGAINFSAFGSRARAEEQSIMNRVAKTAMHYILDGITINAEAAKALCSELYNETVRATQSANIQQLDLFEWADDYEMGPPSPPPDISGLGRNAAAAAMAAWFLDNFEDPSIRTSRDDGEWVYRNGGPCNAREELETAFPQAAEAMFDLAEQQIYEEVEGCLTEWVPSGNRMRPEGRSHG